MIVTDKTYGDVRGLMQPGDVIAFGGATKLSDLVKAATRSTVSHVGIILNAATAASDTLLLEATVHTDTPDKKPQFRVMPESCGAVIAAYERDVWWLPLSPSQRANFDQQGFQAFMDTANGRPFDVLGGGGVLLPDELRKILDLDIFDGGNDQTLLFCSELVANALMAAKLVDDINGTDISPAEICSWDLYSKPAFRLKGIADDIPGWNSQPPGTLAESRESLFKIFLHYRLNKLKAKVPALKHKVEDFLAKLAHHVKDDGHIG